MFPETLICLVKRTQLGLLFALCKKNDYEKMTCYFSLSLTLSLSDSSVMSSRGVREHLTPRKKARQNFPI